MRITNEYSNAWLHAYVVAPIAQWVARMCTPFHIVPETVFQMF